MQKQLHEICPLCNKPGIKFYCEICVKNGNIPYINFSTRLQLMEILYLKKEELLTIKEKIFKYKINISSKMEVNLMPQKELQQKKYVLETNNHLDFIQTLNKNRLDLLKKGFDNNSIFKNDNNCNNLINQILYKQRALNVIQSKFLLKILSDIFYLNLLKHKNFDVEKALNTSKINEESSDDNIEIAFEATELIPTLEYKDQFGQLSHLIYLLQICEILSIVFSVNATKIKLFFNQIRGATLNSHHKSFLKSINKDKSANQIYSSILTFLIHLIHFLDWSFSKTSQALFLLHESTNINYKSSIDLNKIISSTSTLNIIIMLLFSIQKTLTQVIENNQPLSH